MQNHPKRWITAGSGAAVGCPHPRRTGGTGPPSRLGMAAPVEGYRIGPGDVLKITVYGHEDLRPPRGGVGRRPDAVFPHRRCPGQRADADGVRGAPASAPGKDYLVDPQVSVAVQEYRSQKVFVLGEAEKAGAYPLTGRTTLLDVLSQAAAEQTAGRQVVVVRFPKSEAPVTPGTAGSTTLRVEPQEAPGRRRLREPRARERGHGLRSEADELLRSRRGEKAWGLRAGQGDVGARGDHPRGWVHRARRLHGGEDPPEEAGRQPGDDRHRPGGHGSRARELFLSESDTILVPTGNSFYVLGEVKKPGSYQARAGGDGDRRRRPGGWIHGPGRPQPHQDHPDPP